MPEIFVWQRVGLARIIGRLKKGFNE